MPGQRASGTGTVALFSLTLFLSAAIMFSLQPMVGKMLLPLVGGTPAGWVVAMAFFQIMLLLGYLLAHLFSTFTSFRHGLLYLAGLIAGAAFLPLSLTAHAGQMAATPGACDVFVLLSLSVGAPFIALSATSSTIQRLFAAAGHEGSKDPYFLYIASNLGSFSGLLCYPLFIEPEFTIREQTEGMFAAYLALMGLAALCLALSFFSGRPATKPGKERAAPSVPSQQTLAAVGAVSRNRQLTWLSLSFVPSSLLLGVTTYILTDVISAPLIWILPLALYLLTFVIAFAQRPLAPLALLERLHPYTVFAAIFVICLMQATWLQGWAGIPFYLAVFTFVALTCHVRLASLRPLDDPRQLTGYYLMMSLGGALGGTLNAFVIPNLFNRALEFPLMLLGSLFLHPGFSAKTRAGLAAFCVFAACLLLADVVPPDLGIEQVKLRGALASVIVVLALLTPFRPALLKPAPLLLAATTVFMISQYLIADTTTLLTTRNFYGTIRVLQGKSKEGYVLRSMRHGSTIHGEQVQDSPYDKMPTAYHTKAGPLGDVFRAFPPRQAVIIGLGVGAMSCYDAPGRALTFIEIDPAVVDVARGQFSFLSKCVSGTPPRVIVGDGRLELAKLGSEKFDMIAIDAFTSDSIPTHLMTKEAFALYLQHLKPDGVITINISNRYFKLWSTIAATAGTLGLQTKMGADLSPDRPSWSSPSLWMALTRKEAALKSLKQPRWKKIAASPEIRPWTDDYSNLLRTLAFTGTGIGPLK